MVDTPAAREFVEKALERISRQELGGLASSLEEKAGVFGRLLSASHLPALTEEEAFGLLRTVFSSRRRAGVILGSLTLGGFREAASQLLYGDGWVQQRLALFHERIADVGRGVPTSTGFDLGSELLHFAHPEAYWLWTRWMWDPEAETGALPLVLTDEVDLTGDDVAETYRRVGFAVSFIDQVGEAAGFRERGHGSFDTDLFLACVYAIYLYTTLRMRMTQEFNRVIPELGALLKRLLGIHDSPLMLKA